MTLTSEEQNNVSACMDSNWKQASCTEKIMMKRYLLFFFSNSMFILQLTTLY